MASDDEEFLPSLLPVGTPQFGPPLYQHQILIHTLLFYQTVVIIDGILVYDDMIICVTPFLTNNKMTIMNIPGLRISFAYY